MARLLDGDVVYGLLAGHDAVPPRVEVDPLALVGAFSSFEAVPVRGGVHEVDGPVLAGCVLLVAFLAVPGCLVGGSVALLEVGVAERAVHDGEGDLVVVFGVDLQVGRVVLVSDLLAVHQVRAFLLGKRVDAGEVIVGPVIERGADIAEACGHEDTLLRKKWSSPLW